MTALRPYQTDVIAEFDRTREYKNRIILVAPTGSGKTVIAAAIIRAEIAARGSVLVLAHRREIIAQTSQKLSGIGISHGIIQAGFQPRPFERVQVASVQTLHRRAISNETIELPDADLLIIDEAHHCPASSYTAIIDRYPAAALLGLTATPCRGDGRGLGGIFEELIECPQVAALIEQGYLVRTRVYAPVDPDLRGVHTRHGDYVEAELAERMDRPKLIGDIVTHWHKYRRAAEDRRLRGQRRALGPSARRVREIRRARRAHRRRHAEARARRDTRAPGIRRDRARH